MSTRCYTEYLHRSSSSLGDPGSSLSRLVPHATQGPTPLINRLFAVRWGELRVVDLDGRFEPASRMAAD